MLAFEECWDLFKAEQEFELNYHYREAGYTREEYWAVVNTKAAFDLYEKSPDEFMKGHPDADYNGLIDKDVGYKLMEEYVSPEQREYIDYLELNEKISEEVLEFHHIDPEPIPEWKKDVDNIEKLLDNK